MDIKYKSHPAGGKLTKNEIIKFIIDELGGDDNFGYYVFILLDQNDSFIGIEILTRLEDLPTEK